MTAPLALALLVQAPAGGRSTLLPFVFQIVAIFAIFYFVMIRPQQKQRRQHEDRLRNLKRGDEVVTSGGIIGKVVHIAEQKGGKIAMGPMEVPGGDHIIIGIDPQGAEFALVGKA